MKKKNFDNGFDERRAEYRLFRLRRLAYRLFLLEQARITRNEQSLACFTDAELVQAGFRLDGIRGWRVES